MMVGLPDAMGAHPFAQRFAAGLLDLEICVEILRDFVEVIAVTGLGKVDRKSLRAPYWGGRSRGVA